MENLKALETELKIDAEEALETTKELSDLISDMTPQVVIRGARGCTFNIYPSSYKVYEREAESCGGCACCNQDESAVK